MLKFHKDVVINSKEIFENVWSSSFSSCMSFSYRPYIGLLSNHCLTHCLLCCLVICISFFLVLRSSYLLFSSCWLSKCKVACATHIHWRNNSVSCSSLFSSLVSHILVYSVSTQKAEWYGPKQYSHIYRDIDNLAFVRTVIIHPHCICTFRTTCAPPPWPP